MRYYFRAATSAADATKWVISLEGGGECVDDASCQSRAATDLGSSAGYAEQASLYQLNSADAADNPDMATWNSVFVK